MSDRRPEVVGHVYGTETTFDGEDADVERNLAFGSEIAAEIRAALREKIGLTASCGIGHNKLVAKLVGSRHKPDQASILTSTVD
jgi:DNA polymerase iota